MSIWTDGTPTWKKWRKSETISVCDLRGVKDNEKDRVIKTINEMMKKFEFPLKAEGCLSIDEEEIKSIILNSLIDYQNKTTINDDKVVKDLYKIRNASQRLIQAFVIIINEEEYDDLKSGDSRYPGEYGIGHDDGLVILRYTHEEAIRHETGHMFGLGYHHGEGGRPSNSTCVMIYDCNPSTHLQFCNECESELKNIWEKERKTLIKQK